MLFLGEPGTGRTALARQAHAASARRTAPLVEVDLAALPAALVESELFGHRMGAFTGAVADAAGRIERAAGGSLLLENVEGTPLETQAKLLRLLSEKVFSPVGGEERGVDLRFLAIAPEDLARRVELGLFRRDLFHRLAVFVFRVPPLAERRAEIPRIAEAMLDDLRRRFARPDWRFDPAALDALVDAAWPGNLREMRNVIERAALLAAGNVVRPAISSGDGAGVPEPAVRTIAEAEAEAIRHALAMTRGRQAEAARLLGISRKSLWERRRRFGIP